MVVSAGDDHEQRVEVHVSDRAAPADAGPAELGPDWAERMGDLGVPASMTAAAREHAVDATRPAVTAALAAALARWCAVLPPGDAVYAGPDAAAVGSSDLPLAAVDGAFHPRGDVRVVAGDDAGGRSALAWLRDGRWLCVVAGPGRWRRLLLDDPEAITWAEPAALPAALAVAADLGICIAAPDLGPGERRAVDPDRVAEALVELLAGQSAGAARRRSAVTVAAGGRP